MEDAGLRGNDELALRALEHVFEDSLGGADVVGVLQDVLLALGVGDDFRRGVLDLELDQQLLAEELVNDAARRSLGAFSTIFTALDEVQMTSLIAFTSAELLT